MSNDRQHRPVACVHCHKELHKESGVPGIWFDIAVYAVGLISAVAYFWGNIAM